MSPLEEERAFCVNSVSAPGDVCWRTLCLWSPPTLLSPPADRASLRSARIRAKERRNPLLPRYDQSYHASLVSETKIYCTGAADVLAFRSWYYSDLFVEKGDMPSLVMFSKTQRGGRETFPSPTRLRWAALRCCSRASPHYCSMYPITCWIWPPQNLFLRHMLESESGFCLPQVNCLWDFCTRGANPAFVSFAF